MEEGEVGTEEGRKERCFNRGDTHSQGGVTPVEFQDDQSGIIYRPADKLFYII